MFLHVVQSTLSDSLLENEIFQLVAVAVIFDSSSNFAEAIQEHFVIGTVLFIIPWETKSALICRKMIFRVKPKITLSVTETGTYGMIGKGKLNDAHLSKLQQGLNRSTKILIFSSSPKDR